MSHEGGTKYKEDNNRKFEYVIYLSQHLNLNHEVDISLIEEDDNIVAHNPLLAPES